MQTTKLTVGLEMLREHVRQGEFDESASTLSRILVNVINSPAEPKYRKLNTRNPKIAALLATKGVRAVLIGAGFVESGSDLILPDTTGPEGAALALAGLQQQAEERASAEAEAKSADLKKRKETFDKENEDRARMRMGIADDASARKEPGWQAKAAGVKGGKAITSCSDIGIGQGGGG